MDSNEKTDSPSDVTMENDVFVYRNDIAKESASYPSNLVRKIDTMTYHDKKLRTIVKAINALLNLMHSAAPLKL